MPARIMRSLSIIHFSEGSSNWIMRQRNIGIIHYPEGIMNNRNNGYFGALFIIHFSTRKTNPPPPPPHTHTHTTTTENELHTPVRYPTSPFGLKHHDSDPVRPVRLVSPSQQPGRPAPTECACAPRRLQQPICPGLVAGLTPQPACGGQTAAAGAQGLLRLPPPPPSPASSACPSPFMHNE